MKAPFARGFRWAFSFLLLIATLFAAGFASSRPVAAQEPAATPAASSAENEGAQAAQSDERKELDVYRHASIVQTIGHKLGMSTETTAKAFEAVNFLIIFLAIVIPVLRILPKVLRKRSETLNHDIKTAREATADANARLSAVEAKLAGLDAEIQKFRTQIEQESLEDEKRIKASIEEESTRIVASAEQEIAQAAAQARRGLRHFAADLAIAQAEKQLVLTPEVDRAVIDEFIAGATGNGASKGGSK
ncbi:MAG TPA: ATP synthase F0 subunit B [Terracidiphilus sp.]|jgi:F-type H+-transporting ATPase subunit b|nr:ATP synthase F0 subunit B [Terracidiphilus sp.]